MKFAVPALLVWTPIILASLSIAQTTTLKQETLANSSACSSAVGHCLGTFEGMSNGTGGTFNAVPGPVSRVDAREMEYSGATTAIYAHFLPWFCMQPGTTATGPGTICNSHIQVGYNSNDPATVKAQMDDMYSRGIRGPIVDWYGANRIVEEQTTQFVMRDLEGRCSNGTCAMQFAISEDQGSVAYTCPYNGGGADQTDCILGALTRDFDYMNTNYFPSPAYLRIDANTMRPDVQGRPAVFFFMCEACFTTPTPDWNRIYTQLRLHVQSYTTGSPLVWFLFRNSGAFTHIESDGAFAWMNHYGTNDPYGLVYLDDFYDASLRYPTKQTWGAAWKGFDNSLAPWKPAVSITGQQCGSTWLQTWNEVTHNGDYGTSRQLPFMQIVTWNDYEEGTEIETGIDNCLSLTAGTDGTTLSWVPAFSQASGSESTVHHYEVFDSTDGENLTKVATAPTGTRSVTLSGLSLAYGSHIFYVEAVGRASILNKFSNAVTYTKPLPAVGITSVSPTSGSTAGGTAVTISGQGFQAGAKVNFGANAATVRSISTTSIAVTTPPGTAGTIAVAVMNPDGGTATKSSAFTYVNTSFTLSASPTSRTVTRGTVASYNITLTPKNGFTGKATFSISGLPSGATATFSPATLTTSGTTKLNVSTAGAVRGTSSLTVRGVDSTGGISNSVGVSLTIR